uniref:Chitin-binding type-2 domain-containing protein n=1 Tax=Anopheles quadriannulatus TaxID=34691 RepID=A0A182WXD6_ANOQN
MARRMRYGAVVLLVLLVAGSLAMYATNNERCTCAPGPPDYLCPSAPLLQVYLPHELYCTRYYKCTDGRAIEFQCPYGLYFDTQNNTCTCDFTQCYRTDPCIVFVDSCRCCNRQFENTGLAPENFYVCYNDGYAVATTCPVALDPCTGSQVQLQFVNQNYYHGGYHDHDSGLNHDDNNRGYYNDHHGGYNNDHHGGYNHDHHGGYYNDDGGPNKVSP